ncbi:hypothetical protein JZU56_03980, partial [bacterium]|nr:hypothetical protein [bacterium]
PGAHVHAVESAVFVMEGRLQLRQAVTPETFEYVPAGHPFETPFTQKLPGKHGTQLVHSPSE